MKFWHNVVETRNGSSQNLKFRCLCRVALLAHMVTLTTQIASLAQIQNIAKATLIQLLMMVRGRNVCALAIANGQELIADFAHQGISLIQNASLAQSMDIAMATPDLLPTMETGQAASALVIAGTVDLIVACVLQGMCRTLIAPLAALLSIAMVMPRLLWKMDLETVAFALATPGIVA